MSLTTHNALADTEANSYLFVSMRFAWKLYKILGAEKFTDFEPSSVAGFDSKPVQSLDIAIKAYVTIQNQTL